MQIFALPGNEPCAASLARGLGAAVGRVEVRRFPDGEWYVRIDEPKANPDCVVVATRPDAMLLPLVFTARMLRELGASRVGLVAPYLSYLRQDRRFRDGEAITSREFAALVSREVDWLVTVDPHLHRHRDLGEVYSVPARVAHAAPLVADWIRANVERPLLVGPDVESAPWVAETAKALGAPFAVLDKVRRGDRDVSISAAALGEIGPRTPVLVDDIISTGRTMLETVRALDARGAPPAVCIGIHGVLAPGAIEAFGAMRVAALVTTDTLPNPTSRIAVGPVLAAAVSEILAELPPAATGMHGSSA